MSSRRMSTKHAPSGANRGLHARPTILAAAGMLGCMGLFACDDDDDGQERPQPDPMGGTGTSTNMGPGTTGTSVGSGTPGGGTASGSGTGTRGGGTMTGSGTGTSGGGTTASGTGGGTTGSGGVAAGAGGSGAAGTDAMAGTGADAGSQASDLSDGQILFVVDTINAGEVDQARAVLPRLEDAEVRDFAQEMIDEHEPARDRLLDLAEEQDLAAELSEVASTLRQQNEAMIVQLLQDDENVDATYIESQVAAHSQALQLLETLITAADAEAMQTVLTDLRVNVQAHLDRARQLQDSASQ